MKVGFTGTRSGMSINQIKELKEFFKEHIIDEFHHGMCIGADEQAHQISWDEIIHVMKIVIHPPLEKKYISRSCRTSDIGVIVRQPRPYLKRNKDIVNETDILIAAPKNSNQRSGTWYTINYAKGLGRQIVMLRR